MILNEHESVIEDDDKVDTEKFLMMCTLDTDAKLSLEKAFGLKGDTLSASELHEISNYWFHQVPSSHRSTPSSIFPLEMFAAAFGEESVDWDEFSGNVEMVGVLTSGAWVLEEGGVKAGASRPGSVGK